ncbi:MAG: hypothetical protein M3Z13_06065 [Candidatus Dormibacteraeota bacterium]|nr:hypothetical protein [Candidatus Dormibacteraeota bacterium]
MAFLAVLAVSMLPELPREGKLNGWLDEVLILLIAAGGVAWYQRNRYSRSIIPLVLILAATLMKVVAIVFEDADDKGDDFGVGSALIVLLVTHAVIYFRTGRALTDEAPTVAEQGPPPVAQGRQ